MSTKQSLLKAIKAVIDQGEPSTNEFGVCMYRGLNGLKCVVGHLIPDNNYCQDFEDVAVDDSTILRSLEKGALTDSKAEEYLDILQGCHDTAAKETSTREGHFIMLFKDKIRFYVKTERLPKYCLNVL